MYGLGSFIPEDRWRKDLSGTDEWTKVRTDEWNYLGWDIGNREGWTGGVTDLFEEKGRRDGRTKGR